MILLVNISSPKILALEALQVCEFLRHLHLDQPVIKRCLINYRRTSAILTFDFSLHDEHTVFIGSSNSSELRKLDSNEKGYNLCNQSSHILVPVPY